MPLRGSLPTCSGGKGARSARAQSEGLVVGSVIPISHLVVALQDPHRAGSRAGLLVLLPQVRMLRLAAGGVTAVAVLAGLPRDDLEAIEDADLGASHVGRQRALRPVLRLFRLLL